LGGQRRLGGEKHLSRGRGQTAKVGATTGGKKKKHPKYIRAAFPRKVREIDPPWGYWGGVGGTVCVGRCWGGTGNGGGGKKVQMAGKSEGRNNRGPVHGETLGPKLEKKEREMGVHKWQGKRKKFKTKRKKRATCGN